MLSNLIGQFRTGRGGLQFVLLLAALLGLRAISAQPRVVLGNASAELTGPWKFHTGDNPSWSQPDFDDSGWSVMDLTPPNGSHDPYFGTSGFVPGWTVRGYRNYSGFAWYRLRVDVVEHAQDGLALKMPQNVDDAYQVFANGQLIGQFGRFSGKQVSNYITQPRAFLLPAGMNNGPITLAVRMWMKPDTALIEPAAGGLHGPPILGETPVVLAMLRLDWEAVNRLAFSGLPEAAILLLAIAVGFSLYALDREEQAYLWLAVNCLIVLLVIVLSQVVYHTDWLVAAEALFLRDVILLPIGFALWISFWASWFRLDRLAHLRRLVGTLVVLEAFGTALQREPLYGRLLPVDSLTWVSPLTLTIKLLLGAALLWVAGRGILKDRTEGLLALPAVALLGVAQYQLELQLFHAPILFFFFGYTVTISQIATALSLAIVTVLLLRRFLHAQRMREQWLLEMEQARQVQQVLIPEKIASVPGFALESEYRPALQVGGDFFQILPGPDGSILAVIGDVSGKGLRAAMLVSLIVGSVRTLAAYTRDPAEILRGINDRLYGRLSNQFATCLALLIAPGGRTTFANAGHIPPFVNGRELAMAGSIPLGIVEDAPIEEGSLTLGSGEWLVLLTDGVVEARNRRHELFGFSRLSEMLGQDCSAVNIAAAAQQFGQDDDITVLRIKRTERIARPAPAREEGHEPIAGIVEYS